LTGVAPGGSYAGTVLAGGVLSALGMGFSLVPATITSMEGVTPQESGLASGLLNTSRLMGGALGLAVLSTIATAQEHGVSSVAQGMTDGFALAFEVGAFLCLAGAAVAGWFLRPSSAAQEPERETSRERVIEPEPASPAHEEPELLAA
jgi:hypothetical protein